MSAAKKRIIQAVERHPCIYDKSLKQYKDPDELNYAWEKISEDTGMTANECKDAWMKLRNSLVNAIKRRQRKPTIAKWLYEDEMYFILPHLCFRSTRMQKTEYDQTPKLERLSPHPEYDRGTTDNEHPDRSDTVESKRCDPIELESRNEADSERSNEDSNASSERNRRSAVAERRTVGRDAVELFFLSVATAAARLPRERQVRVRMRVSDAVGAAELRALAATTTRPPTDAAAGATGKRPHRPRRKHLRTASGDNNS